MAASAEKISEMKRNYAAFIRLLPELLPKHEGQYALMRHGDILEYFPNPQTALLSGRKRFPDDMFSVQEVRKSKADFGWYSRAPINSAL